MCFPRSAVFMITMVITATCCCHAGELPDSQSIRLYLDMATHKIATHEPLLVVVTLHNRDSRPSLKVRPYFTHRRRLAFWISADDGPFKLSAYGKYIGFRPIDHDYEEIELGKCRRWDELLLLRAPNGSGAQRFLFAKPGKYRVKAELKLPLDDSIMRLESRPADLVVEPPSSGDAAARDLIASPEVAAYLQTGPYYLRKQRRWLIPDEAERKLEIVAKQHLKSPYADYANYALGIQYWLNYSSATSQSERAAYASKAFKHFSAISARIPALRARCAYRQLGMLPMVPRLFTRANFYRIKGDLSRGISLPTDLLLVPAVPGWPRTGLLELEILYINDNRLDKIVNYRYEKSVTFGDVLESLSEQTGVPLDTQPKQKADSMNGHRDISTSLREWMDSTRGMNGYWEARGNGYYLVVEPRHSGQKQED